MDFYGFYPPYPYIPAVYDERQPQLERRVLQLERENVVQGQEITRLNQEILRLNQEIRRINDEIMRMNRVNQEQSERIRRLEQMRPPIR